MNRVLQERKEELIKLKKEIEIKKQENKQQERLKNHKILLTKCRLVMPYILSGCISVSALSMFLGLPFYKDDIKKYKNIKKEIDSKGNISYTEQYDEFSDMKSIINYYSRWNEENGIYERRVNTYEINNPLDILTLSNKEEVNIGDILGNKISSRIEKTNNISNINETDYLEVILYYTDENDFIILKESVDTNIISSVIHLLSLCFAQYLTRLYRKRLSDFDYKEEIENIKIKYKDDELEKLLMKYEIKKENYDRLVK